MKLGLRGAAAITVLAALLAGCTDVRSGVASTSQEAGAHNVEVVGGTTITRAPMFMPDGSMAPALSRAEIEPADWKDGFQCTQEELFDGLNRCKAARSGWTFHFCGVRSSTMYCPQLETSGGMTPNVTSALVTGQSMVGVEGVVPGPTPWAVELSDGRRCVYGRPLGGARPDATARYVCESADDILWQVDEGAVFTETPDGWTAQVGVDELGKPLDTVRVKTVIFFTDR